MDEAGMDEAGMDEAGMDEADEIIQRLQLAPHPEGGWYRETWRAENTHAEDGVADQGLTGPEISASSRSPGTAILFLLEAGQLSHWHRIDASELWLFHAGAPLILQTATGERGEGLITTTRLGPDTLAGDQPQQIVLPGEWQSAQSSGGWSLVSCVVIPGFDFAYFELAPPDWSPEAIRSARPAS